MWNYMLLLSVFIINASNDVSSSTVCLLNSLRRSKICQRKNIFEQINYNIKYVTVKIIVYDMFSFFFSDGTTKTNQILYLKIL